MNTLVAFSLMVAAVLAEPQYFYSGVVPNSGFYGGLGGVYPVSGSYLGGSHVVSPNVVSQYAVPTPYAAVAYPSQDTSRGLPQPIQDTPEVQAAKAVFAKQYEQAAVRSAVKSVNVASGPFVHHSISKRAAVLQTPASTSPLVYSAPATPYYNAASYVAPYTAGVVPYTAGVAPYAAGVSAYTAGVAPYTAGVAAYNYAPYNYGVAPAVTRYY